MSPSSAQTRALFAGSPAAIGNVADYLFENCLKPEHVRRPAFIVNEQSYSFSDIYDRVCRVTNLLGKLGINAGDRIAMSVKDGPDFPAIFIGALKAGIVPIPLNTYLKPADYLYYANDAGIRLFFADESLAEMIAGIRPQFATVEHVYVTGRPSSKFPSFAEAIAQLPDRAKTLPRRGDEMGFMLYSSGSTGAPKGVIHTHADLYWATELFGLGAQGIKAGDVIQCPPKMFFAYGLGNQVYFPLRAAATVIVNDMPATAARLWDLWLRHEPTIVMSVPTLFAGMLRLAQTEIGQQRVRKAFHRLRFCVSGGEALPPVLYEQWKEFTGTEILDAVGTTEMTHMFTMNRPGHAVSGSCGRMVDGYEGIIVNENGDELPVGEIGNLLVRGPSAAREYWHKPERTAAVMRFGGVLTGDKARMDAEGNLFFVGRSDDMLRVGGVWVSPVEIEARLCEHPAVLECAAVGVADDNQMIKPKAFVVLKAGASLGADSETVLKDFCRERLAHIKCPRWVEIVDELPKTTTGKIQRFRLRDRAASGRDINEPESNQHLA